MESYCDHTYTDTQQEDSFLLDDKNSLPLLNDFGAKEKPYCIKCRRLSSNHIDTNIPEASWEENNHCRTERNDSLVNMYPPVLTTNRRISFSGDSTDSPLLANELYSDVLINDSRMNSDDDLHCHSKTSQRNNSQAWKKLMFAGFMCLIFMVAELIGGHIAGSLAIMTDAAHLLSDFIGFLVSIFAIIIGSKQPTKKMPFGYYRAEILGALFSIVVVWILTGVFMYFAVMRVVHQDFEIDPDTMMIVSGIGVIINIIMGIILHGNCFDMPHNHSHGNGSNHSHNNINVRAAVIHVLGDFIQSVGVFIAALIIKQYPKAKVADPICTFIFSILVIFTTRTVFRDSLNILMEAFPLKLDYNLIYTTLKSITGVRNVHNLQVWSLTTDRYSMSVHLAVDSSTDKDDILKCATSLVYNKFKIHTATIQIESFNEEHHSRCSECRIPLH